MATDPPPAGAREPGASITVARSYIEDLRREARRQRLKLRAVELELARLRADRARADDAADSA